MPYTAAQLIAAWTATTDGIPPDDITAAVLTSFGTQIAAGTATDTQALTYVINNADKTTAVANLAYLFFTGKSPTKAGLDYLLNSTLNPTDLNDPYYTKFGLENRFINFAANLGVLGEGSLAFATTYGAMTFAAYVASIYDKIVGTTYAALAGINATTAIADIVSRQAALTQIARDAGMITASSTAAQADIALKAATAGYIMGEAMKADVGLYAAASNNFTFSLIAGTPTYNVDLVTTYASLGGGVGSPVAPYFLVPAVPAGATYRLTTGADTFTGLAGADTFNASDLQPDGVTRAPVFNLTDNLNGGGGIDTLAITSVGAGAYTVAAGTVQAIEIATIVGDAGVTANTAAWAGLTSLTVTSVGSATVTTPATTAIVINAALGTGTVTVDGGASVTVAATGVNVGAGTAVAVGATTAPTGAVVISTITTTGADATAGAITVKGGTTVNITQTANNPFNTALTHGPVTITGGASTTAVTIAGTAPATKGVGAAGVVGAAVVINDVNLATATLGTITTASVDSYSSVAITDSALSSLSLARGGGNVTITNTGGGASSAKTLGLTVNGLTGGIFADSDVYTTVNITTTGAASLLADIDDGAMTALTVAGTQVLTLGTTANATTLATVNVTGSAGLTATFAQASVTAVNTAGSTGTSTVTIASATASYTGGAGVDKVTQTGAVTKAIALGLGDDTMTLAAGVVAAAGTISGGAGGTDTLVMTAADADAADASGVFGGQVTGFERLTLTAGGGATVDLAALAAGNSTWANYVTAAGGNTLTLSNLSAAGSTLILNGAGTAYVLTPATTWGGLADALTIGVTDGTNGSIGFGSVTAEGVEALTLTTANTNATPSASVLGTLTVVDTTAKTIVVTGNAGLSLAQTSTALTSVDASGITLGGFTWTSNPAAAVAVVKGSATGPNSVSLVANTAAAVTYTGGSGDDSVVLPTNKATTLVLGAGNNGVTGGGANDQTLSITALGGNDTIATVGNGNNTVNLGDGTNAYQGGTGTTSYTGGTGADTVVLGVTATGTSIAVLDAGTNSYTAAGGNHTVTALGGNDTVSIGGTGTNSVSLGDGTNSYTAGGASTNTYVGGTGVDTVAMGGGADRITLSTGADSLTGAAGIDTYVVTSAVLASADTTTIVDFAAGAGLDKFEVTKSLMAGTPGGGYYAGTAAGLTAGTAYGVIVLNAVGYADVATAEAAVAAQSTSATGALVVFLNTTLNKAQVFYDSNIDANGSLTSAAVIATLDNITLIGGVAAFDTTNFSLL